MCITSCRVVSQTCHALVTPVQVFEGESLLVHPPQPASSLTVQLAPARDAPVMLLMKVLVGTRTCQVYHVFDLEIELPKYAMYAAEEGAQQSSLPTSHVCCTVQHPISRVATWVETRYVSGGQLYAVPVCCIVA